MARVIIDESGHHPAHRQSLRSPGNRSRKWAL